MTARTALIHEQGMTYIEIVENSWRGSTITEA